DLFDVQDQLARAIVESLSIPLSSGEKRRLTSDLPASARAYEFYLRANQVSHDPTMLSVAGELYRSALDRSEERRVGKECRSLCDWSSDVCSSDLPASARAYEFYLRANQVSHDPTMLSVAGELYRSALD